MLLVGQKLFQGRRNDAETPKDLGRNLGAGSSSSKAAFAGLAVNTRIKH